MTFKITDTVSLRDAAVELFTELLLASRRPDQVTRIHDPALEQQALAAGIGDLTQRPQIQGPGGNR